MNVDASEPGTNVSLVATAVAASRGDAGEEVEEVEEVGAGLLGSSSGVEDGDDSSRLLKNCEA